MKRVVVYWRERPEEGDGAVTVYNNVTRDTVDRANGLLFLRDLAGLEHIINLNAVQTLYAKEIETPATEKTQ